MPVNYFYSQAIKITGLLGTELGSVTGMSLTDGQAFVGNVVLLLDQLKKLNRGGKLIEAINRSGHTVTIFCAGKKANGGQTDSVTKAHTEGARAEVDCSVVSFAPRHKIMPLKERGIADAATSTAGYDQGIVGLGTAKKVMTTPLKGIMNYGQKTDQQSAYKAEIAAVGAPVKTAQTAPELTRIINRTPFHITRAAIARAGGISEKELKEMEAGTLKINQETYYRLAFFLYEYMTPGPGADTQIRFENKVNFAADPTPGATFSPTTNFNDAPGYIVLGHELIHAWRMMVGRRLVRSGWEEEAMTTGLNQFSKLDFTENKLRADAKLPTRPSYQSGFCSCFFMQMAGAMQ